MDWKQQMKDSCDAGAMPERPNAARDARVKAIMDGRAKRLADVKSKDVEFFEGPEGYVHPIRGTKGYSNKKAGK